MSLNLPICGIFWKKIKEMNLQAMEARDQGPYTLDCVYSEYTRLELSDIPTQAINLKKCLIVMRNQV